MVKELNLSEVFEKRVKGLREGEVVKGKVVRVSSGEAIVDINYKSEGSIPLREFKNKGELKVGDEVDVSIESLEPDRQGMISLSKEKAEVLSFWKDIEEKYKRGEPIEGKIITPVKGGFRVDIGVIAFLPGSLASIRPIANPNELVNKVSMFKIIKIDRFHKNVVLSRREMLEEEEKEEKASVLSKFKVGDLVKGKVKNIVDFGAFIDIGGINGLLHINNMSWGRINHPSQILKLNQEIEVVILSIDEGKGEISLGLKQKSPSPWESAEKKYAVDSKVKGKVVNITDYGAFIQLEEGLEGLLHISELSWTRKLKHPSEVVAMGDELELLVIGIDKEKEKISFSLKKLEPNPYEVFKEKYPPGTVIKGKVYNVMDQGALIEVEKGLDGFLHISDISEAEIGNPSEVLKKGDKIDVMVLDVDPEKKKISLGMKQILK